jgi:GT2 family glycosyltransferase
VVAFDERFTAAWREDSDLHFKLLALPGRVAAAPRAVVKHPVRPVPDWTYGIRQHRKIAFDALLFKKHPRLYRERIRRLPPLHYYAMVGACVAAVAALAIGSTALAGVALLAWLGLTLAFTLRRLRGTSKARGHVAEMIASSVAIPFVAVFWRLAGALRYRVLFL